MIVYYASDVKNHFFDNASLKAAEKYGWFVVSMKAD